MKAGKLQRENSLLRFLVCHVILKVHTQTERKVITNKFEINRIWAHKSRACADVILPDVSPDVPVQSRSQSLRSP